jgi:peptidoglycan/xylan/chitin deacetylase (PgdA/CDA1 family)
MKKNLIINLHVVSNAEWFENLLLYLKSTYNMVSLSRFGYAENYRKRCSLCHLTFDDGDRTFYETAFPLLLKHRVPATIFVSPRSVTEHFNFWFQEVGKYDTAAMQRAFAQELNISQEKIAPFDYLSLLKTQPLNIIQKIISNYQKHTNTSPKPFRNINLEELLEIHRSGVVTIGAHTLHHPILPNETAECSENEIVDSIAELEKLLGCKVYYFAYPNGRYGFDYGKREIEILRKIGIKLALTTEPHFINAKTDPLQFPRIGVTKGSIRSIKIKLKLGSWWEKLKYIGKTSEIEMKTKIIALLKSAN